MEALLSFVFDNLFFVIIILAVLSSLFSRGRRGTGGGRGMPPFGGGGADPLGRPREMRPGTEPRRAETRRMEPELRRSGPRAASPYGDPRPTAPQPPPTGPSQQEVYRSRFDSPASRRAAFVEPARSAGSAYDALRSSDAPGAASNAARAAQPSGLARAQAGPGDPAISDGTSPIYRAQDASELREQARYGLMWAEVFARPRAVRKFHGPRR
jgi:hypothetical protein